MRIWGVGGGDMYIYSSIIQMTQVAISERFYHASSMFQAQVEKFIASKKMWEKRVPTTKTDL